MTDAIKMLTKEDIVPSVADKLAFNLAPAIVTFAAVMTYAVHSLRQASWCRQT